MLSLSLFLKAASGKDGLELGFFGFWGFVSLFICFGMFDFGESLH